MKKDYDAIKSGEKKEFKRQTRTEKEKAKEAALDAAIAEDAAKEEEVIDLYDDAAPKDILTTFNSDWLGELGEIKKWD